MTATNTLQFPISEAPAMGQPLAVAEGVYWLRMPLPFSICGYWKTMQAGPS